MGLLRNRFRDRIRPPPGPPELAVPSPLVNSSDHAVPVANQPQDEQENQKEQQAHHHHQQQQQHSFPRVSSATPPRSPLPSRLSGTFSRKMYGSTSGRGSSSNGGGSGGDDGVAGRFSGGGALSMFLRPRGSGDSSTRSTILDQASKFRRLLREGTALRSRDSDASVHLDDVPDTADPFPDQLSDAAFKIAAAAAATSPLGRPRASSSPAPPGGVSLSSSLSQKQLQQQQRRLQQQDQQQQQQQQQQHHHHHHHHHQQQQQHVRGGPTHVALPLSAMNRDIPNEVHPGETCSDGGVSFVVPPGWTAMRTMDCFMLVNGLSIGFVRAAPAKRAAEALLEVDRLQVMSHVTALSSPVFEEDEEGVYATVTYLSTMGKGRGVAIFNDDFKGCACVYALCGPSEAEGMITNSLRHLRGTVRPPAGEACSRGTEADRVQESAVRKDSEERKSIVSDLPGLTEPLAKLEQDLKQKEVGAASCAIQ